MTTALPAAVDLTAVEQTRLHELEGVIERGLGTFVEVGQALMEVRDSRLYRDDFATFEDYCQNRWAMNRDVADRTIRSAEVVTTLRPIGRMPESQAREFAPLLNEPAALHDAWAEVQERAELEQRPVTANLVRDVVDQKRGMDVHYSSATDLWSTPQDLFDQLHREFPFGLDVCATAENAKCTRFFTVEDDGLSQDWTGTCWMNPPYGDEIPKWVKKAHESSVTGRAKVVALLPARVDTAWWWDYCRFAEIRFLRGRLKFGGGVNSAPFPSAVVIFGEPASVVWWDRVRA